MADKPKAPVDAEAHFRIDEQERRLSEIGKATSPEAIQALISGVQAALQASSRADVEELRRQVMASQSDSKAMLQVVDLLGSFLAKQDALNSKMDQLLSTLSSPREREVTAHLPSGPITMRVRPT